MQGIVKPGGFCCTSSSVISVVSHYIAGHNPVKPKRLSASRRPCYPSSNKSGQADSPPRCSFVLNSTSLTPLRPATYH